MSAIFFVDINLKSQNPTQNPKNEEEKQVSTVTQKEGNYQVKGAKTQNSKPIYLGFWTEGFWDKTANTLHPEVLKALEIKIGKQAAIAHYYRGWEELNTANLLSELLTISQNGWRPMVSANPYFFNECPANGQPLYKAIAQGNCDQFLKEVGQNLKKFAKPMFLRFAWEMNIPSMEWEIARTGSSNEDFISAWRHIHDIIYKEGATNVLWVFAPDVGNTLYRNIYPGDAYVDWTALDGYNWGTTQPWSKWQSFSQVFQSAYKEITKIAPNKPLMLSEVNTTDVGGDKAKWYEDMLITQIPANFPKIGAIVFYNEDRQATEKVNWKIDVSNFTLASFRKGVNSPWYSSSF